MISRDSLAIEHIVDQSVDRCAGGVILILPHSTYIFNWIQVEIQAGPGRAGSGQTISWMWCTIFLSDPYSAKECIVPRTSISVSMKKCARLDDIALP